MYSILRNAPPNAQASRRRGRPRASITETQVNQERRTDTMNIQTLNDAAFHAACDIALHETAKVILREAVEAACEQLDLCGYSSVEIDVMGMVRTLLIDRLERNHAEYLRDVATSHSPRDKAAISGSYRQDIAALRVA
ncbi:MAG: hypothetical protein ABSD31_13595 [Candidatus Binataceae bacterium]